MGPTFREKAVYTYMYIYIYMDMMGWDVVGCFGKCNVGQCAVYTCQKSRLRQPFSRAPHDDEQIQQSQRASSHPWLPGLSGNQTAH